ncbi:MAG: inositol monophosphatase, partial [Prevotella sp.]|nr:inositol monophosphatase [Prevotella sp.]
MLGVVYEICADECFCAWLGGGSYLNGQSLKVNASALSDALVCFQLPYNSDAYSPVAQHLVRQFYGRVASIRMLGSAAIALCYVAAGRLDAYAEKFIGRWDYMAGALIVSEAGGHCTDYNGSTDFTQGNSIVATNGIIHQELLDGILSA